METTESKPHRASPTRFVARAGRDGAGAGRAQIQIQAVAVGGQLACALGRCQRGSAHRCERPPPTRTGPEPARHACATPRSRPRAPAPLRGCAACTLHPCDGAARQAAGVLLLAAAMLD